MGDELVRDEAAQGGTGPAEHLARTMWRLCEPVFAIITFAPEAQAAFDEIGMRGFTRRFLAARSAPLLTRSPDVVTAAFYGFAPRVVHRAIPAVWDIAPPERVLEARADASAAALRALTGADDAALARAADLLEPVVDSLDHSGRVLSAANAAVKAGGDPAARVWQACTTLREHRGDGHLAALVAAELSGLESLVLRAGLDLTRADLQPYRGWTDAEWEAASSALTARGLLTPDATATPAGTALYASVEATTDAAASTPWTALAPTTLTALRAALTPLSRACATRLPYPNPVGLDPTTLPTP